MNVSPEYAILSVALSTAAFILSVVHLARVTKTYRQYHDERAAVGLSKAIGLLVVALGMLISAAGLPLDSALYSVAGLMLARGALIALLATLLLVAGRPDP